MSESTSRASYCRRMRGGPPGRGNPSNSARRKGKDRLRDPVGIAGKGGPMASVRYDKVSEVSQKRRSVWALVEKEGEHGRLALLLQFPPGADAFG